LITIVTLLSRSPIISLPIAAVTSATYSRTCGWRDWYTGTPCARRRVKVVGG
jgi:hypothetical protein